jgi:hypothetical protein
VAVTVTDVTPTAEEVQIWFRVWLAEPTSGRFVQVNVGELLGVTFVTTASSAITEKTMTSVVAVVRAGIARVPVPSARSTEAPMLTATGQLLR